MCNCPYDPLAPLYRQLDALFSLPQTAALVAVLKLVALLKKATFSSDDVAESYRLRQLDKTGQAGELRWSSSGYERNLVHAGQGYEVWAMTWHPAACTPIHDHGGSSACVIKVLVGTVSETRFEPCGDDYARETGVPRLLTAGDVVYSKDQDIHEVKAEPNRRAVTLHVYVPGLPKEQMKVYKRLPTSGRCPDRL